MATAFKRGRPIYYDHELKEWFWKEDGLSINKEKPCSRCKRLPVLDGIDACIGKRIEMVSSICCGHGVEESYIIRN